MSSRRGGRDARTTRHSGPPATDTFAVTLALGSLAAAVVIFFAFAVPAFTERRTLHRIEVEKRGLRDRLVDTLRARQERSAALEWDVQTVLAAIDELGITPAELLDQADGPGR